MLLSVAQIGLKPHQCLLGKNNSMEIVSEKMLMNQVKRIGKLCKTTVISKKESLDNFSPFILVVSYFIHELLRSLHHQRDFYFCFFEKCVVYNQTQAVLL